jgi:hypothetical protein
MSIVSATLTLLANSRWIALPGTSLFAREHCERKKKNLTVLKATLLQELRS